ncbi:MAG: HAMP domain-containing sensor histidine kinase [Thermogemmata sp.]|uniref:histidine kinase n=1 Tax=Thermogemmata fonticola TaxID=2755323 RepID=A0A7V8VB96_9BACT|nr:HAMP domain-containing sensor histidine kinase [Thermogemmata fonticola]MBA2224849.1 HAMP domain-containing histidine kinase [Thermogemmata fonticola]MCX8141050.1 HAMP domain-containing histidine kinase [Gemmataceae bacterium]
MRSIRRSLTLYLLLLVALMLAGVWFVIDQAAMQAFAAREEAGQHLILSRYEENVRREQAQIDQILFDKARELANVMQLHYGQSYEIEAVKFPTVTAVSPLMFLTSQPGLWAVPTSGSVPVLPVPTGGGGSPPSLGSGAGGSGPPAGGGSPPLVTFRRPLPHHFAWVQFYFGNLPLPEEFIQHFDDDKGSSDYFQINTTGGREWRSRSLGSRKLPFNPSDLESRSSSGGDAQRLVEAENLIDWTFGTVELQPDGEKVRRVVYKVPYFLRSPPRRRDWPQRSLLGAWGAWAAAGGIGLPPAASGTAGLPRIYVQCARPDREIQHRLQQLAEERDRELAELTADIEAVRHQLRQRIAGVGLVAFLAVAAGGPLLVGRGLRPLGKLSDAVSRVSEKDFKLPHDGSDLSAELAPIHARLTQTLDLLRRAFAREKQAVADISHELRTPIAALLATLDVALMKPRDPEQYRTCLQECRLIARQLGQLVERIMTLATLDAGNDRLDIGPVQVHELASACVAVIRPLASTNQITIDYDVPSDLVMETDAGKLREVLTNLLHNAVEYNRPGGLVELSIWTQQHEVIVQVRDTGIGMTPEVMEKIFERFYRADASRHAAGVHAGLGLAIVKEYVERLGGTIEVESQPEVGSTFRLRLPRQWTSRQQTDG